MARLPTRDDLGPLPSARSGRPIARVDTSAVGKGMASLGSAGIKIGAALKKQADEGDPNEKFEVQRRLIEFETAQEAAAREAEGSITGDGAGFADTIGRTYDAGANTLVDKARADGLSERALQTLDIGLLRTRGQIYNRAQTHELAARETHHLDQTNRTLRTLTDRTVANPERLSRSLKEGYELINSSRLSPAAKLRERERFRFELQKAELEQRIRTADTMEEREAILNDLRTLRKPKEGEPEPTAAPTPGPATGPATVRFNNPGGMYPGQSSRRFGATHTETIGGGHPIAVFPNVESGVAAQFDLLNRSYAGKMLSAIIKKWSGGNNSGAYIRAVSKATGLEPDAVVTQEMLRDSAFAIPFARAMANWEAGRTSPITDAQWIAGHARAFGDEGAAPAPAPTPGADAGTGEGAADGDEDGEAFVFSDDARYDLSAAERITMLNNVRTHFRASILQPLRNGLENIVNGEEPETDKQGRTALDHARRFMTPLQVDAWEQRWRKAQRLNEATAEVYRRPHHRLGQYVENLPSSIRDTVRRRAERLLKLYETDPARAVEGGNLKGKDRMPPVSVDPETGMPSVVNVTGDEDVRLPAHPAVRKARELLAHIKPAMTLGTDAEGNPAMVPVPGAEERAAQEAWRIIIEGRLAAQRERGVPEDRLAPITKEEAGRVLAFPPNASSMSPDDFDRYMKAAVDRAYQTYGPYARMALESALRLRGNLSETDSEAAQYLIGKMIDGTPLNRADLDRFARRMDLDREEAAWLGVDINKPEAFSWMGMGGRSYAIPGEGFAGIPGAGPSRLPVDQPPAPPPEEPGFFDRMFGGSGAPAAPSGPAPVTGSPTAPGARATGVPGVTAQQWPEPSPEAVQGLLKHPDMAAEFDRYYGPGAAAMYLQGLNQPQQRPARR